LPISHSEVESRPRPGFVYRCHVCRLELVLDTETEKLTVAPLPAAEPTKKRRLVRE
jgi:hypothetical protein